MRFVRDHASRGNGPLPEKSFRNWNFSKAHPAHLKTKLKQPRAIPQRLPKEVLVLPIVRARILPLVLRAPAVDSIFSRLPKKITLGALPPLHHQRNCRVSRIRIRPWQLGVVVECDGNTLLRHDEACIHIAVSKLALRVNIVWAEMFRGVMAQPPRLAGYGGQVRQAVALLIPVHHAIGPIGCLGYRLAFLRSACIPRHDGLPFFRSPARRSWS